jgi:PST family polysaccharide transporter
VGPADYGLVALAMPFILFCNVMADGGLSTALARRQDPGANLESTVFWIGGGIGAGLAVLAAGLAFPVGLALGQPRLPWLIAALAPILALSGLHRGGQCAGDPRAAVRGVRGRRRDLDPGQRGGGPWRRP